LLPKAALVLLYIVYIPVIQAPIIAHARHSVLVLPFLAMLAAVTLVSIWRALKNNHSGRLHKQTGDSASGK